jgi:hypothetical protein
MPNIFERGPDQYKENVNESTAPVTSADLGGYTIEMDEHGSLTIVSGETVIPITDLDRTIHILIQYREMLRSGARP